MKFINVHTHNYSGNETFLEIVNQYPIEFNAILPNYSVGIHPWKIELSSIEDDLQIINRVAKNLNCLAIGECGLDKRIETPLNLQIEVFEKQILIAIEHKKPLILHCVGAFQEVIEIKNRLNINVPVIIHGFSKNIQLAKQLLDNGFYLSFGKYLMLNLELKTVFSDSPNNKFFLETDSSDFNIEEIYMQAAKYKNIEIDKLKEIVSTNFDTVFKK